MTVLIFSNIPNKNKIITLQIIRLHFNSNNNILPKSNNIDITPRKIICYCEKRSIKLKMRSKNVSVYCNIVNLILILE